ncbi:hypothetical protein R5R35_002035 [Gryllus longicercus]|uniref:GST C-terminal domain-containing protein n=1 Tax=Gryllus longicercus TaxID=2509291 RepID=A0AAN9VHM1_9ORTH|nr:Uncharacterized protein GBIM_13955 [Gryllus bimaculatus]
MGCDEKCIRQVSQYLNAPVGKLAFDVGGNISATLSNSTVTGFATIVLSLAKLSKTPQFGRNIEDEVVVRQWIEYIACYGRCLESSSSRRVLEELNDVLSSGAYFVGNYQTLADVVIYYILYNVMLGLTLQEKEQYQHLSRWFANMQQDPALRQKNRLLVFSRIPLYS